MMMENADRQTDTTENIVTVQPKKSFRKKFGIFVVCLGISSLMWLFIELTRDYTTDLKYAVSFTNVPKDLILQNQNDSSITVGITAQGFELLTTRLFRKRHELTVDLSEIRIRKQSQGYSAYVPASKLLQQVARQIGFSKTVSYIRPDTLFFMFSDVYRKEVPVRLNFSYSFEQQFQLYDSIEWSPKTVIVSSIKDVIDTIRFVSTVRTVKTDIDSSLSFKIPLSRPLGRGMISYSTDSIRVRLPVQKFTETTFTIPVRIVGNTSQLKIFPDQAEIKCMVPMVDYRNIEADNFLATVQADGKTLTQNPKLRINLVNVPLGVKVIKVKPEFVEYIIISP
ncbi:MAG TPA: hypothetical protein PKI35_02325 [Bacteroidales bacterium]|nr:hypothetical protein [Bacteroidales bacterium]